MSSAVIINTPRRLCWESNPMFPTLVWLLFDILEQQQCEGRCWLLVKGLGFASGPFPHKMGDRDTLLQLAALVVLEIKGGCGWTDGILPRNPLPRIPMEKRHGKYAWPAPAPLVWAHRFCSRMSWENLWLGSAATKLHYWLENDKCFLM